MDKNLDISVKGS